MSLELHFPFETQCWLEHPLKNNLKNVFFFCFPDEKMKICSVHCSEPAQNSFYHQLKFTPKSYWSPLSDFFTLSSFFLQALQLDFYERTSFTKNTVPNHFIWICEPGQEAKKYQQLRNSYNIKHKVECMPWPNECYTDLRGHLQRVEIVNKLTYTKSNSNFYVVKFYE